MLGCHERSVRIAVASGGVLFLEKWLVCGGWASRRPFGEKGTGGWVARCCATGVSVSVYVLETSRACRDLLFKLAKGFCMCCELRTVRVAGRGSVVMPQMEAWWWVAQNHQHSRIW